MEEKNVMIKENAEGNLILSGKNYEALFQGSMHHYEGETSGDHYSSGSTYHEYWFSGIGFLKDKGRSRKYFFKFATACCGTSSRLEELLLRLPEPLTMAQIAKSSRLPDIVLQDIAQQLKSCPKEIPEIIIKSIKEDDLIFMGIIPDKLGQLYLGL